MRIFSSAILLKPSTRKHVFHASRVADVVGSGGGGIGGSHDQQDVNKMYTLRLVFFWEINRGVRRSGNIWESFRCMTNIFE